VVSNDTLVHFPNHFDSDVLRDGNTSQLLERHVAIEFKQPAPFGR
jgi:hypothetical protein